MQTQQRILQDVMDILMKDGMDEKTAVESMIHWIGYRFNVQEGMLSPTLKLKVWDDLATINLEPLTEDFVDYIGAFINDHYKHTIAVKTFYLQPVDVQAYTENMIAQFAGSGFKRFLDKCGGTGHLMMSISKAFGRQTMIYMAEPDVTLYRIALINAKMHQIPSRILNADYRHHSLEPDSKNWRHAGMWNPVPWKHLEPATAGS